MTEPEGMNYIAIVELGASVEHVECKGFQEHDDAIKWVRDHVEAAHGGLGNAWHSFAPFNYDLGGEPSVARFNMSWIMTVDGPTQGFVIQVNN